MGPLSVFVDKWTDTCLLFRHWPSPKLGINLGTLATKPVAIHDSSRSLVTQLFRYIWVPEMNDEFDSFVTKVSQKFIAVDINGLGHLDTVLPRNGGNAMTLLGRPRMSFWILAKHLLDDVSTHLPLEVTSRTTGKDPKRFEVLFVCLEPWTGCSLRGGVRKLLEVLVKHLGKRNGSF